MQEMEADLQKQDNYFYAHTQPFGVTTGNSHKHQLAFRMQVVFLSVALKRQQGA